MPLAVFNVELRFDILNLRLVQSVSYYSCQLKIVAFVLGSASFGSLLTLVSNKVQHWKNYSLSLAFFHCARRYKEIATQYI